jgi:hypothetical protein
VVSVASKKVPLFKVGKELRLRVDDQQAEAEGLAVKDEAETEENTGVRRGSSG